MASQDFEPPFHWHTSDLNYTTFDHLHGQSLFFVAIFFSFILLIILLYVYFHFIFHHGLVSGVTSSSSSSVPHEIALPARSPGIDGTAINNLPVFVHRSLGNSDIMCNNIVGEFSECSICLDVFEGEEIVKVLPICHHAYHSVCVDKWLSTQSSCPLCRASLHVESSSEPTCL